MTALITTQVAANVSKYTAANVDGLAQTNQYSLYAFIGIAAALVFANLGAAYGTARSGVGICSIGVKNSDLIFKSLIPGIMAGILGIYGLIVSVIYIGGVTEYSDLTGPPSVSNMSAYRHLAGGLCVGISALGSGITIGIVGDAGVRANAMEPQMYVGMILILIFAEALGLYGLIVAIIMN